MTAGGDHRAVSVLYCTGNDGKFKEASHVVEAYNARCAARGSRFRATLTQVDPDPVEIQGDAADVARAKVTAALAALPPEALEGEDYVVTEDVGLSLRCLNGFPGPYCKPMLEAIGDRGLWDLASRYDDRAATVTCTLAAIRVRGGEEARDASPRLHVGVIEGAILGPPRGDVKHGKASWKGGREMLRHKTAHLLAWGLSSLTTTSFGVQSRTPSLAGAVFGRGIAGGINQR